MTLPPCPARFAAKKAAVLAQLAQPEDQYSDASPKGSVDKGVRPLLEVLNKIDGFVTTSSCAGRVAVFLEGRRGGGEEVDITRLPVPLASPPTTAAASTGGKGGGGTWLFVSHEPLLDGSKRQSQDSYADMDWAAVFGLEAGNDSADEHDEHDGDERLVHLKFEPMILHVLTASLAHAQLLLRCAVAAGFRESGAVSVAPNDGAPPVGVVTLEHDGPMPVVAVRTIGLGLSSVVGVASNSAGGAGGAGGRLATCIVSRSYLARLARVVDQRFISNRERTERLREAVVTAMEKENGSGGARSKPGWEDAAARKARLRAEGLQRQAALKAEKDLTDEQQGHRGQGTS